MLFCFGLFALLLYYTVVANAECSYTYRNSSQQHIEAESREYESQGYHRCEFLIQVLSTRQQLQLNFTRLTGFGLQAPPSHGQPQGQGTTDTEKTKEKEEGGRGGGIGGGVEEDGEGEGYQETDLGERTGGGESQRPRLVASTGRPPTPTRVGTATHLSMPASSSPSPRHIATQPATTTPAAGRGQQLYANSNTNNTTNFGSKQTMADPSLPTVLTTTLTPQGRQPSRQGTQPSRQGTQPSRQEAHPSGQGGAPCLPMVEIVEVVGEGQEERRQQICHQHHNTQTPIVFQYASSVRIVYQWQQNHSSGFTLYFDVSDSHSGEKCVHTCDGSRCLTDSSKLCDGHADCHDQSDERTPVCSHLATSTSASGNTDGDSLVTVIVLPACVAVVLVLCVLCVLLRRHWCALHRTMHRGNGHAAHLALPQSHSSEGLTPSSTQECNEQAVALLPSSHRSSHKSWHHPHAHSHAHTPPAPPQGPPGPHVGLPPNIPVSPDGEEGYRASQLRLLHPRYHQTAHSHLFKPPPNKTVYDRESPPPYSATPSPGSYTCGSAPPASSSSFYSSSPPVLGRGEFLPAGRERLVRDSEGYPVVSRCYTMCEPVPRRHHHHQHQHNHHQQQKQQQQQQQRHGAAALRHDDRQRHCHSPRDGGGGGGGFGAGQDRSNNNNNNNNNGFAGHYHQRPPHVHGAFTVKDALHPSAPPPLLVDSSPSSARDRTSAGVAPPPHPPPIHPPPQAVTVMPSSPLCGGTVVWDSSDSGSSGSVGGHPSPDELEAPPSYDLAFSQGRAGNMVDNNNCQGVTTPLANTSPTSAPPAGTITTTATTTTSNNNNSDTSGV